MYFGNRSVHFLNVRFAGVISQERITVYLLLLLNRFVVAPFSRLSLELSRWKKLTCREQAYSVVYVKATLFQDIVTGMDSEISSVVQMLVAYVREIKTNQLFSIFS